jgi:hypothetical protein
MLERAVEAGPALFLSYAKVHTRACLLQDRDSCAKYQAKNHPASTSECKKSIYHIRATERMERVMPAIRIELMTLSLLVIRSTTEPSGLFL